MNTLIAKDIRNNWKATTTIMISDDRQLSITTSKVDGGNLRTSASVGKTEGMFISFKIFDDFYSVKADKRHKRITSKVVETQHSEIMMDIDSIITEAKAFYNLA